MKFGLIAVVSLLVLALLFSLAACKSGITGSVPKEIPKDVPLNGIQVCIGGKGGNCQIIQLNTTANAAEDCAENTSNSSAEGVAGSCSAT